MRYRITVVFDVDCSDNVNEPGALWTVVDTDLVMMPEPEDTEKP